MHYPNTTRDNKTLGVRLLEASSLLSQLNTQKALVDTYVAQYQSPAQGYARQCGELMGRMKSAEWGVKISSQSDLPYSHQLASSTGKHQQPTLPFALLLISDRICYRSLLS